MKKAVPGSPIHLFGWSLGGKIALEAAVILERLGHKKVFVYVLDAFLNLTSLGGDVEALIEEHVRTNMVSSDNKINKNETDDYHSIPPT